MAKPTTDELAAIRTHARTAGLTIDPSGAVALLRRVGSSHETGVYLMWPTVQEAVDAGMLASTFNSMAHSVCSSNARACTS